MIKFLEKVSNFLYEWVLSTRAADFPTVYQNGHGHGCGMMWLFIFVVTVPLVVTLVYFLIAKKDISNDTKKNYRLFCLLGYLALLVANVLSLVKIANGQDIFTWNLLKACSIDIAYYLIFFALWTELFRQIAHSNTTIKSLI